MNHVLMLPSFLDCRWSGGGSFFVEQADIMRRFAGWKINILMPCARHVIKIRRRKLQPARGVEVEESGGVEKWFGYYPYWLPRKTRAAWREFGEKLFLQYAQKHGMPDLLWVQCIPNAGYLARHLSQKYGVPYFVHEHIRMYARETLSSRLRARIGEVIGDSLYCAAVGEDMRRAMLRQTGAAEDKICVVHNPVGIEFANAAVAPKKSGAPFSFVSTAHLRPDKNVDSVIRAFAEINSETPDVRLVVAGGGSEESALQSLARELNVLDKIEFTGRQNRAQICARLRNADAFVSASDYETFGVALAEALTCGLPAVSTKTGIAAAENIIDPETGAIAASAKAANVAAAMRAVMRGDYDRDRIRRRALAMCAPDVFVKRITDILDAARA